MPIEYGNLGVFGTERCIVATCLYWNDGDTTLTLGPVDELGSQPEKPTFDGVLKTPYREVLLFDVNIPEIMKMEVPGKETRIRIWTNHPTEPDNVIIGLG